MTVKKLPLEGVRVVEFVHMVMGPTCGLILADLGAEVIKVEPMPGGDKTRDLSGGGHIGCGGSGNGSKKSAGHNGCFGGTSAHGTGGCQGQVIEKLTCTQSSEKGTKYDKPGHNGGDDSDDHPPDTFGAKIHPSQSH